MGVQDLILSSESACPTLQPCSIVGTQLAFGSKNLHHTPSSRTSFILRQRLRNTVSIRLRRSMIPASSFALVGFAA